MRDELSMKPLNNECGIMNLDTKKGNGTHWTCWHKANKIWYYFDSYGLMPSIEFENYALIELLINAYLFINK